MFDPPLNRSLAFRATGVLAFVALTMWTGSVACLWANESQLVFQTERTHFAVNRPATFDSLLEIRTTDGLRLDAVSLAYEGPSPYWILFCPPSAGTIHGRVRGHLEALHAAGYNVFAFDYRGFGRNPGHPSEAGLYEDALTAYRHLTQQVGVAPHRIVLAGRSLGSAVAVELSTRVPSAGLLLLSAIDSVPATAARVYPWAPVGLLATQRFDSMSKAPRVRVPVLQVHAATDRLVPLAAARALFRRFPGRKLMLETGGGHNRAGFDGSGALEAALISFWPLSTSGLRDQGVGVRDSEGPPGSHSVVSNR
jgi:pimeloyl-ACP methyl ester carboxylesterase